LIPILAAGVAAPAWGDAGAEAAAALAQRVLGERAAEFAFETIPKDDGRDVFEVSCADGRALVRGSSPVAMATGLNWYLKYHCHACVSWVGDQLDLPKPLPAVESFRKVTPCRYRYYFNYCTFSYTMAWWDWARWEREIDWMALNGINMPLSVTGQEAVWQQVFRDLGLSDDAINRFFVGPAYLPFGWMGCMDGWGGPLTQTWIDAHRELQQQIVARERELGMTPVLQGFTGHAPPELKQVFPEIRLQQLPKWCGFPGTHFVDPTDPLFVRIGKAFVEAQTRLYGTDHLYASDTFIEMSPPSSEPAFLAEMGLAVYQAMAAADPEAVWVMQGWIFVNNPKFWRPPQAEALLGAVPDDRMILLDLFCETRPAWNRTEAFYGKPWVWCIVHNFGGKLGMQGDLSVIAEGPPAAWASPDRGRLSGVGMMMEGIEQNPIVYDLMMETAWREEAPGLDTWVRDYARRRYGLGHPHAEEAWSLLRRTVYGTGYTPAPVVCARPGLKALRGRRSSPPYDVPTLLRAWETLLECADELGALDTYQHDLVDVARQVVMGAANALCADMLDQYDAQDRAAFWDAAKRFLRSIRDADALLATRREFLLGKWIADARRWGQNDEEKRHYEWNARNQITLWGPRDSVLHEYARKEWSGLLTGFYLPRWERFIERLNGALAAGTAFDADAFEEEIRAWEEAWTHGREPYPAEPSGEPVAEARRLLKRYGPLVAEAHKAETPVVTLTTGKPVTCSAALPPYPAHLANDGRSGDTDRYWATDVTNDPEAWWQVDLGEPTTVGRVVVVGYYGDSRFYGFTVETSVDGERWEMAADRRDNKAPSTHKGYTCRFEPRPVRYLRVTQTHNSANTGRHLAEVMAFAE